MRPEACLVVKSANPRVAMPAMNSSSVVRGIFSVPPFMDLEYRECVQERKSLSGVGRDSESRRGQTPIKRVSKPSEPVVVLIGSVREILRSFSEIKKATRSIAVERSEIGRKRRFDRIESGEPTFLCEGHR